MIKVKVNLKTQPYEVYIGKHILNNIGKYLSFSKSKKAFILSDRRLKVSAQRLQKNLEELDWKVTCVNVSSIESFKDFRKIYPLYGEFIKAKMDRHSVVFAIGGGVVGDAAGFLASTYMRGIAWVGLPTTLLGQVDSGIGGKTGINHINGKNLIGTFHQPSLVFCDLSFLESLNKRDLISGLGEILKYALVTGNDFFIYLQKNWRKILELDPKVLSDVVGKCVKIKARTVARDERDENGIREALNFGHTFGHALEASTHFKYFRHGEAVIWGMRVAVELSEIRGSINSMVKSNINTFLSKIPIPQIPSKLRFSEIVDHLKNDKKQIHGKVRFVLLSDIGKVFTDGDVSTHDLMRAVKNLKVKLRN